MSAPSRHGGDTYIEATGVSGDPTRTNTEIGLSLLDLKVAVAIGQIRAELAEPGI